MYDFDIEKTYKPYHQRRVIGSKFIDPPGKMFVTGQLSPKGDFFYPSWQVVIASFCVDFLSVQNSTYHNIRERPIDT